MKTKVIYTLLILVAITLACKKKTKVNDNFVFYTGRTKRNFIVNPKWKHVGIILKSAVNVYKTPGIKSKMFTRLEENGYVNFKSQ